jgi:hypothetical protein
VAIAAVILLVGQLGVRALNRRVAEANYAGRPSGEVSQTVGAMDGLRAVWSVTENLIGQTWYLLVATFGLLAVVALAAARPTVLWPCALRCAGTSFCCSSSGPACWWSVRPSS